ncbi:MAG TPA: FAD-dependent oxidoreductase [Aggregatilineaceae bacterium]|nr:FAD-dependent oxidoreductase [Aggregatilineaceae bacterium]
MTPTLGSNAHPLRIAIVGSGPSGFYTAEHLLKQDRWTVEIDMYDRLPTPFGLVRGGVAPDHAKIKSVTRVYDRTAAHPNFRFYGNVTFGTDITHADLTRYYHAIIYAVGAQTDRRLDIPGEDLAGSHAATEFVGWYNGHPDYRDLSFDLAQERVAVIGNGNVATDVVRMLARSEAELHTTDVADYALEELRQSRVREIYMLGRRGPVQARFTTPELKELGELTDSDIVVAPKELDLDPLSQEYLLSGEDHTAAHNFEILKQFSQSAPSGRPKKIILRFLVSPVELIGSDHVEAIKVVKNQICERKHFLSPCPTDEFETIPVGLVFRSIGYRGMPLPDVPFDEENGIIPNAQGRILDTDHRAIAGEYVVGWIKRGPTGIIGTNKPDAQETAKQVLNDIARGKLLDPVEPAHDAVDAWLRGRGVHFVTYDDWRILDRLEIERGARIGRPRVKFTDVEEMLAMLGEHKHELVPAGV